MAQENKKKNTVPFPTMSADDLIGKETPVKTATVHPSNEEEDRPEIEEEEFFGNLADDEAEEDFDFSDFEEDEFDAEDRLELNEDHIPGGQGGGHSSERDQKRNLYKGKKAAKIVSALFGTAGSMIGGGPRRSYKLDDEDQEELAEAFADWFEVTQFNMTPGEALIGVIIALSIPTGDRVWKDRQAKLKREEFDEARRTAELNKIQYGERSEQAVEAKVQVMKVKPKIGRKQFDVDADGFYEKSKGGKYISKANRTEKADEYIEEIIARCKARDPDVPQAIINKECCIYMYGDDYNE